ncbi:MAG: hypothetical protein ABUS51_02025 [Acidobacteriota bacterium]
MRRVVFSVFASLLAALAPGYAPLSAQEAKASPYVSVAGTVTKSDVAGKVVSIKLDKGEDTTVKYDERTSIMRIPAGETDVKKASPADAKEIEAGDKVIARVLTADPVGKAARTIIFTKQSDIALRRQKTEEEWKNATSGLVTSIDAGAKQIKFTTKVPGSPAPKEVTLDISGKVDYQHYNPDSGKYEPGALDQLKTGDQLRVLGQKNADLTEIKAENIGFGSFKTIGVQVKSIDTAANQITGTETASKKLVVIALRPDTSLRKFSDMAALMVAQQINPSYQQARGGRGGRGGAAGDAPRGGDAGGRGAGAPQGIAPGMPAGAPGAEGAAASGQARGGRGGFGGGRGGRGIDVGRIIEQQPSITLAELKAGDSIIVTGATGNDPAKLTATALVAGVEPILRAAPSNGADPLAGSWSMGGGGGEGGGGN